MQAHGDRYLWVNPPAIPLTTEELDAVFELPYQRILTQPTTVRKFPRDMIKFSVNIMRGCFGGCSFCSITEHEGRWIQSRSEDSVIREIEQIRDRPRIYGTILISDPDSQHVSSQLQERRDHAHCRRLSRVFPTICKTPLPDHSATTSLYRRARQLPASSAS